MQPWWAETNDIVNGTSESSAAWDRPALGGRLLPGFWVVRVSLSREIEKKKQKGKDGATVTDQGDNPTEVNLTGELYTKEEWESWQDISTILASKKKGAERMPLYIEHPQTAVRGIMSVWIESMEEELDPKGDVYKISMKCVEWTPRPKETVTKKVVKSENVQQSVVDTFGPLPTIQQEVERDTAQMNQRLLDAFKKYQGPK